MSYQAFITKISLRPHPNADRLQLATVLGEQVVVGQGMDDNEWVVYFPENGKLSLDYCQENDLFPRFNEAVNRCAELGLEPVPLLQKIDITGLALVEWAKLTSEGESTLATHPREGICIRFDAPTGVKVFKAKSHNFLIMEGVATEQEVSLEDLA